MTDILDYIAEFLGLTIGFGVAEITVIFVAVIVLLLVLMLLSAFGLKRLLRQFADQSAAQNAALLDEFRMITLALHEEAKRSVSSEGSPAKDGARPPPATPAPPETPTQPAMPTPPETPVNPSLKR